MMKAIMWVGDRTSADGCEEERAESEKRKLNFNDDFFLSRAN